MQIVKERRKQGRLGIDHQSMAVMVFPNITVSYNVLDISPSGIAFSYAGWEKWPKDGLKIDIIDEKFYLADIPVRITNDVQLLDPSKILRRCGVEFSNLEAGKKTSLFRYIDRLINH